MNYTWVIIGTTIGFIALATLLLWPIYKFLKKQEEVSKEWTQEEIDRIKRENKPR